MTDTTAIAPEQQTPESVNEPTLLEIAGSVMPDPQTVDAIRAIIESGNVTEDNLLILEHHLIALTGASPETLWGDTTQINAETDVAVLTLAQEAVEGLREQEQAAGRTVLRDSLTMMFEVINTSGDPRVFSNAAEQWLWSPFGAPMAASGTAPAGMQRWQAHTGMLGIGTDIDTWQNYETTRMEWHVSQCSQTVTQATQAIADVLPTLLDQNMAASLELVKDIAETNPAEQWPPELAAWGDTCWELAERAADAAALTLEWCSAEHTLRLLAGDNSDNIEGTALGIIVALAQVYAVTQRWQAYAPQRPENDPQGSMSYWMTDVRALDYWSACLSSAICRYGYTANGSQGAAAMLLNQPVG